MSATKIFACTSLIVFAIAAQPVFAQDTGNNPGGAPSSSNGQAPAQQQRHAHKHHHRHKGTSPANPGGAPTTNG